MAIKSNTNKPAKQDRQHIRNLNTLQKRLLAIYNAAAVEAANIGALVEDFNPDELFRFSDFPITHDRIRKLMQDLGTAVERTIANGIDIEWALANEKNDELCDKVFGNISLSPRNKRRYYKNNADALEAFKLRKQNGLGLSERVWEYTERYKEEIENGLSLALGTGKNAHQIARALQGYLRNPDKLFRRVRDKYGRLKLSQAAKNYHPQRGVYRSSYKNALRLAVTETNMAYRASDYARYQQLDFIVGQEVHLSQTNHPVTDICDELKGRYPKDFKFVGWHPFCRCYVTSILKTESEFLSDLNNGTDTPSRNAVTNVPGAFENWVEDNVDRIKAADAKGTSPYFIRDNKKAVKDILNKNKDGRR